MPRPSSKSNSLSTSSKEQPLPATARLSKLDPMVQLFRNEVTTFLSQYQADEIEVLATVERISSNGTQSSIQLCQATDGRESWVTRTEGGREFFPRVGRVQKRVRGAEDEEEKEQVEEEQYEEVTPVKGKGIGRKVKATPVAVGGASSSKRVPRAPKKSRRSAPGPSRSHSDEEEEEHRQHRRHSSPANDSELTEREEMRRNVVEALGRGSKRRCSSKKEDSIVKEEDVDDLASLCGRVDGLEVESVLDVEDDFDHTIFDANSIAGPSNLFT